MMIMDHFGGKFKSLYKICYFGICYVTVAKFVGKFKFLVRIGYFVEKFEFYDIFGRYECLAASHMTMTDHHDISLLWQIQLLSAPAA